MKRPPVALTIIFCLGIFIASKIKIPFLLIYSLALLFLALSIFSLRKKSNFVFLFCLMFLIGGAVLKNSQALPKCHIARFVSYKDNTVYTIKGFIDSPPGIKGNRVSFVFKTEELQSNSFRQNCCGRILVYLKRGKELLYGQELILSGNLHRPYSFGGFRRESYKDYLYSQGIFSVMHVKSMQFSGKSNRGLWVKKFALWLKAKMERIIFKYMSNLSAAVLDAMVLGEKSHIAPPVYNSMVKSGTVHILVVSGFNVGIVSFILLLFLKVVRVPRNLRFYIASPCLVIYCLMTGASTPVMRATVMAIFFLLGFLFKREPDIYHSLALAMLFILVVSPRQLFDIGFQLSFGSVLSIVYLYPKIKSFLRVELIKIKFFRVLVEGCIVSFSAWLGTMGFIAYYFKVFSPIAVFANIFIVPLATLITLCGFSIVLMGCICSALTPFFVATSELIIVLLLGINSLLIKIPGAYFYL